VRLSVTPIGSGRLSAGQAAKAVVEYLAGVAKQLPGPDFTSPGVTERAVPDLGEATAYYADSIEGPGTWLGMGANALGLDGVVDHNAFARVLEGCCRHWEQQRRSIEALEAAGMRPHRAWLVASRASDKPTAPFRVTRQEVAAFADRRQRPVVRVGYDLTLSTEKSIAVLALLSRGDRQRQVLGAIDAANDTAIAFLEERAAVGRRRGRRVGTEGLVVASFLHATSRALDPFPHRHNVVANAVVDEHGERRALDDRALYRHAPAAARAFSGAERRHPSRLSRPRVARYHRSWLARVARAALQAHRSGGPIAGGGDMEAQSNAMPEF